MSIILRDALVSDIDAMYELEQDLFSVDTWSREKFYEEIAGAPGRGGHRYFVVAQDDSGRILGYADLLAAKGTAHIGTIAVARDRWGTDLGKRIVEDLIAKATALRCREVLAEVRADNVPVQRLCERFGAKRIGMRRDFYRGDIDVIVMRRALKGGLKIRGVVRYEISRGLRALRLRRGFRQPLRAAVTSRRDTAGSATHS